MGKSGEMSMEFRHLGKSGLKVSAVSYGNWITHGSQLEAEQATACVRALSTPASPLSIPPTCTQMDGRDHPRRGLAAERRDGLEICTKVYFPTGPVRMTPACHANTFMRRSTPRYGGSRPITSISTKLIATTTRRH